MSAQANSDQSQSDPPRTDPSQTDRPDTGQIPTGEPQPNEPDEESGISVQVGSYTAEMQGRAEGLHTYRWNASNAEQVEIVALDPVALSSPTYLVRHPVQPWLYAVSETTPGQVSALRVDDSGALSLLNTVPSGGDGGCHLAFDATYEFLLVAHYTKGSVASLAISPDGTLSETAAIHFFSGSGPDPERQDRSHAHQVVCDGDEILVCDLGADVIHRLRIDTAGKLTELDPITLPAGSGPRHLAISDDQLVVACELSGELWLATRTTSGWDQRAVVLSSGVQTSSGAQTPERVYPSALVMDGDEIYVANRGVDTFAVFELDRQAHTLTRIAEVATAARCPRDLVLSNNRVWVAGQVEDVISVFVRTSPAADGRPSFAWTLDFQLPTPSPACIVLGYPTAVEVSPGGAIT